MSARSRPYALVIRYYSDGTTNSESVDTADRLETVINNLKSNISGILVSFDVFILKETFTKTQIWSRINE
jgi:hypothetical protein